jgi:ABC-type uncharacterized transport system permease subunit
MDRISANLGEQESCQLDDFHEKAQSQLMTKLLLISSAVGFWASFLFRLLLLEKNSLRYDRICTVIEKVSLAGFTAGLVLYISKLQIIDGQVRSDFFDMPVSFLLFAWCISAANAASEIAYNNQSTALFSNFWTALSLTLSPAAAEKFKGFFTYDLDWLSFHRLCFLLGYAFCVLAFPLVLFFLITTWRAANLPEKDREKTKRTLWNLDRMAYRMILWALPLLTAGIITEALLLMELNQIPLPQELIGEKQETLLAIAAWVICGVYLHARLFFGWKYLKASSLYLAGLTLLLVGHLTHTYLRLQ